MMNEIKLLIMETLKNDYNKKQPETKRNSESTRNSFMCRASYESHFLFWRNSFINEGSSFNKQGVSSTTNGEPKPNRQSF